ncbi:MAG TPA: agmatine deiminase family protein, partial [Methylomirabilota bacterium]|nr:agmatine deiminase family protein [Methylomirabilota bacterium]
MTTVLPAEWAPQDAVQLTWPRPDGDFERWFEAVERTFLALALAITRYEPLIVATAGNAEELRKRLQRMGVPARRLKVHSVPSNDVWARDHGPITVFRNKKPVHLDFTFNGWGGKFDATDDNQITRRLAEHDAWAAPVETVDFVLEGGAIDTDGAGTLLTTERCLLAPTRNPGLSKAQ